MAEPKGALNMLAQALRDPEYYESVGRGLLDTGNRGIVAGLLGAPVDLTTMALRPLGYTVPTPVGGSEWIGNKMQQYGIVSPQRNALAEALAGFVDPATMQTGALKMAGLLGATMQKQSPLSRLISSQRYIDDARVAEKMKTGDFTVKVSPPFKIDGETLQAIEDGHHALQAAKRAGVRPKIVVQSPRENDRIGLLNSGKTNDFLEASYVDSPWYYMDTGREIW